MFTGLMNFLANVWDAWKQIFQDVWGYVRSGYAWLVGIFLAVIAVLVTFVTWITDQVTEVATLIGNIVLPSADVTQSVGNWLQVINYVFPLQETFVIMSAISVLWLTMLLVRVIKWIREMVIA
jgi:hypothetical protein